MPAIVADVAADAVASPLNPAPTGASLLRRPVTGQCPSAPRRPPEVRTRGGRGRAPSGLPEIGAARMYADLVGEVGVRLLSPETLADATAVRSDGPDEVLCHPARWGSGFMIANEVESWVGPGSFGFTGAGGHVGMGHAGRRVGFGHTMTEMFGNLTGDPRPEAVLDARARCLDTR